MAKTEDMIKGLLFQLEMNKAKKIKNKLLKQLKFYYNKAFMECCDFEYFKKLMNSEFIRPNLICNFFPRTFDKYAYYSNIIDFSSNIEYEFRWRIFCFAYYSKELSFFVNQRKKYDNLVLLDKYEEASKIVDEIESKLGISFWSIECKFFLYSKLKKNPNDLLEEIPRNANAIYEAIINFYELKNRENITYNEYLYFVKKHIKYLRKNIPELKNEIEFFYFMSIASSYHYNKEKVVSILSEIRYLSLIDQYLFFINICCSNVVLENDNLYTVIEKYIPVLNYIQDNQLIAIRFIFDKMENRMSNYTLNSSLDIAKNKFINGDIIGAQKDILTLLEESPSNVEAINFLIETEVLLGENFSFFENTNLDKLLNCIALTYKLDSDMEKCMGYINMITNQTSFSSWSMNLLNSINYRSKLYGKITTKILRLLCFTQYLDIETVLACAERENNFCYVEKKLNGTDLYIQFRKELLMKRYNEAINLCKIENINDLMIIRNEKESIKNKTLHLRKLNGTDVIMAIRGFKIFWSEIDLEKNFDLVLSLSVDLIIENIYAYLFIPLEKIVKFIDERERSIRKNICSCIIYYVYAYFYNIDKKEDLGIVCEDFFLFNKINKPSLIQIDDDKYKRKYLIYFLKKVCNIKVLDSSGICNSSQERDKERVDICNRLCQLDIDNLKEYENEIRDLIQKIMINAELKIIEENRIHVNVDGVKERLINDYEIDFVRYKVYQEYRDASFMNITKIIESSRLLEREKIVSQYEETEIKNVIDSANRILEELIIHIRDAFVSSDEYGLNGYLSLNIRHGTLADELRSPIFRAKLNAIQDVYTNKYVVNEQWIEFCTEEDKKIICNAITKFYLTTDNIVNKLKNVYIQIRTENSDTDAVFDYRIYKDFMPLISKKAQETQSFEEFIDFVLDVLWMITERNLCNVRELIQGKIAEEYLQAFDLLKKEVGKVEDISKIRDLNQKINETSMDISIVLDKICYWFHRSTESKHNDFDLDFVFKLGLETIRNMHPEKNFEIKELEKTESDKFSGTSLKNFESIFYNLFDNIYKKGKENRGKIIIGYKLRYKDNRVEIYLENDFDCNKNMENDIMNVEKAKKLIETNEYLERVKDEGGTGILKIFKIIKYDLRSIPLIDFGYLVDKNKFFISIKF